MALPRALILCLMCLLAAAVTTVVTLVIAPVASAETPGGADLGRVDLGKRHYLIALPDTPEGAPVILALHGGGGGPEQFERATRLAEEATARGYAVVLPAGSGRDDAAGLTWNAGYCCGYAARQRIEDKVFLSDVIADSVLRFGLDGRRVFLTGMSNGAMMAESYAAAHPKSVRAVAAVAGTMDIGHETPRGPVPLLLIHGTADPRVPYAGGRGEDGLVATEFAAVEDVARAFAKALDLDPDPVEARIDRRIDGTAVRIREWRRGAEPGVRLMAVEGGGHHWPGSRRLWPLAGKTREFRANSEVLGFFDRFR